MNTQLLTIKAKKFGVRLAAMRQKKGIPVETLGRWINDSSEQIEKIERGESSLSLPQIEWIAHQFGLKPETLFLNELNSLKEPQVEEQLSKQYISLRDRMIALFLKKTRTEQNKTLDDVANSCELSTDDLERYESGSSPIPWPVLDCLCSEYHLPATSLISQGSVEKKAATVDSVEGQSATSNPDEMTEFITNPANRPYLELAKKISEMDAEKLRSLAEGLLEITY